MDIGVDVPEVCLADYFNSPRANISMKMTPASGTQGTSSACLPIGMYESLIVNRDENVYEQPNPAKQQPTSDSHPENEYVCITEVNMEEPEYDVPSALNTQKTQNE